MGAVGKWGRDQRANENSAHWHRNLNRRRGKATEDQTAQEYEMLSEGKKRKSEARKMEKRIKVEQNLRQSGGANKRRKIKKIWHTYARKKSMQKYHKGKY